ncbi:hypothetical protein BJV82DRAFT_662721 [Fennellomyces sp. T-0311]|nr:hypothetical protein BJV82DRAFT_662721 [Fennellomyces sp. T-0311]
MGKRKEQQSSTNPKRKVSCLPCRLKKVKCDGNKPCQRCQAKDTECQYAKPAPVGRPPKNAVVNKLVLNRNEGPISNLGSSSQCKEFIFEHVSYTKQTNTESFMFGGKEVGLNYYVNEIYNSFFGPDNAASAEIAESATMAGELAKLVNNVKMYDMLQYFTWMTADVVNIVLRRFSRLPLDNYIEPEFTKYSLQLDQSKDFFDDSLKTTVNPLNSLPPQQATRLIEIFFCIHPYSLMFNKTIILQSYWTDSADPLLMTVIYGTTAHISQLLDGKPVALWETSTCRGQRNTFINYAYVILNKSTAEASLSKYQALILLALFEVTFGYSKRGMSLFALGHMMATRIGLFDLSKRTMTEVEEESCLMTFWSAFNCTVRGCIEMDHIPREVLSRFSQGFPPPNIDASTSYQFDKENHNHRLFKSYPYLIESFYSASVISRFSGKLFMFFPEAKANFFRRRPCTIPTSDSSTSTALLQLNHVDVEDALNDILHAFGTFIQQNREQWSYQQQYTIEATYIMYRIHFSFLKLFVLTARPDGIYESRPTSGGHRLGRIPVMIPTTNVDMETEIDLNDIEVVIRMHLVVPMAIQLVTMTTDFLADPANFSHKPEWLPHGVIASSLETSAKILMLKYRRDPWDNQSWYCLESIQTLSNNHRWQTWTSMIIIDKKLSEFFQQYPAPPSGSATHTTSGSSSMSPAAVTPAETDLIGVVNDVEQIHISDQQGDVQLESLIESVLGEYCN